MIKCEVIEAFTLNDFGKISNIQRRTFDKPGYLYVGDIFECDYKMAKYLTGDNEKGKVVVKIIEIKVKK